MSPSIIKGLLAGQEVRLVNIPVKRPYGAWDDLHGLTGDTAGAAFSDAIRKAAESNYGHAGRAFLGKLVEDKRDWSDALAQYRATEELGAQSGDGQDQRVAARFALIALAGEVATEYGVLPWPPGTAAATILRETYVGRVGGNNEYHTRKRSHLRFLLSGRAGRVISDRLSVLVKGEDICRSHLSFAATHASAFVRLTSTTLENSLQMTSVSFL